MNKFIFPSVVLLSLLLTACGSSQITPAKLARQYSNCRTHQTKSTICLKYQNQFHQMNQMLIYYSTVGNLGQDIIKAQVQLVTLQDKLGKKDISDKKKNVLEQAVSKQQNKIVVLQAMFLLMD